MTASLEGLEKLNYVRVSIETKEDANFVHHFVLLFFFTQVLLVNGFDSHKFTSKFVHAKTDFTESASSQHFTSSVEIGIGIRCITLLIEAVPHSS